MERMVGVKQRPPIILRQFLHDYKNLFEQLSPQSINIQDKMNLTNNKARFNAVVENCSLDHLKQTNDVNISKFTPGITQLYYKNPINIPQKAYKLVTLRELNSAKGKSQRNPFKRTRDSFKLVSLPPVMPDDKKCAFYNELIITIRVYRPARATHVGKTLEKPVFAEEFECLGSNFLTELRDKISCICNKYQYFDISDNPESELPEKKTDPGYFFITDTFYNDKRNPENPEYSETIMNWARTASGFNNCNFNVAKMEETRFIDLTVSLEFPQLYQHHGNCEHVFVFSQIEVVTPASECRFQTQYPRLRSFSLYNNRLCNICGVSHYNFIVEKSDRQLHDPAYLCRKCFISYHYINGEKIGSFKAYRINTINNECNVSSEVTEYEETDDESDEIEET